jgi:hypothetical protein
MSFFIEKDSKGKELPNWNKEDALVMDGAQEIPKPEVWAPNLVCVVDNGLFKAAAYCADQHDFTRFTQTYDRPTRWFKYLPAAELSGYIAFLASRSGNN